MRIRAKVENKTSAWVADFRPRVGGATVHNGFYWTNTTGINSEPGIGSDWTKVGAIDTGNSNGLIRISGYTGYLVDKRGGGNASILEAANFMYGEGQFYAGDYIIGYPLIDNPLVNEDIFPIHRAKLPIVL